MIIKEPLKIAVDSFVEFLDNYCYENGLTVRIKEVNLDKDGSKSCIIYLTPDSSLSSLAFNTPFTFYYDNVIVSTDTMVVDSVVLSKVSFVELNTKLISN